MSNSDRAASMERVLREESAALVQLCEVVGTAPYLQAVEWILASSGRIVMCGVGKSGHVARKAAGTLSSTGTLALFLHAAEAVHGDLGMVSASDIVILMSHSGETDEIVKLFPAIKAIGARTILITGRPESSAGRAADLVLDTRVQAEACPHNLAPTTSTTVMMALCDALAVSVMEARGFGREDFARFHPSGALGRRLLLTVADVMRRGDDLALVSADEPILAVMEKITKAGAGAACVVDAAGALIGFISDGDLRRWFVAGKTVEGFARDLMTAASTTVQPTLLAAEALEMFQNLARKIGEMPVVDSTGRVVGLLMLKDLLRSGIL